MTYYDTRELIADIRAFYAGNEERWVWGTIATTDSGEHCDPNSPDAKRWCVVGAMCALSNTDSYYGLPIRMRAASNALISQLSVSDLPTFNDRCASLAEVLAELDRADAQLCAAYREQRDSAWRAAFEYPELANFYARCAAELHVEAL